MYALFWALSELLGLPTDLVAIAHHLHNLSEAEVMGRFVAEELHWVRYYGALALGRLIGAIAAFAVAVWLYRGGAGVRKFYAIDDHEVEAAPKDSL